MTTNNSINSGYPVDVPAGGTGASSFTAYAPVCGGTTATGAFQGVASAGTSGQLLTSNGAGALPTYQTSSGGGSWAYVTTSTASGASAISITSMGSYSQYVLIGSNISAATNGVTLLVEFSTDGGSSWLTSGYASVLFYWNGAGSNVGSSTSYVVLTVANAMSSSHVANLRLNIYNVGTSTLTNVTGQCIWPDTFSSGGGLSGMVTAKAPASSSINAVRVRTSSGNISGTLRLYGIST